MASDTLGDLVEHRTGLQESWVWTYGDDGRQVMVIYDHSFVTAMMLYPWRSTRTLWHRDRYKNDVKMERWPAPTGVAKLAIEKAQQHREERRARA